MKIVGAILAALISFAGAAQASSWTKILSCSGEVGVLVVDRDSDHPEVMQVVIMGRVAVNVIASGIQGNSIEMPPYLRLYDDGNKLVINGLTMTESFNPLDPDPSKIHVVEGGGGLARLEYRSGSEIDPQANYRFYNCSRSGF